MTTALENHEVRVRGVVQGVGFRPAMYRLALDCGLNGEVFNDSNGVLIRLSGDPEGIRRFLQRLPAEAPPLSKVDAIESRRVEADWHYSDFRISHSGHSRGATEITPDAAVCPECLREVNNPRDRRYLYPFTNCTHCGPRLSIVLGIPYDRQNTTMRSFPMCAACRREYEDPLDRRFHAQPVACHDCGPRLFIHGAAETRLEDRAEGMGADRVARQLKVIDQALREGRILAIKGLGGFHLCCDAANHAAVEELRRRKHRCGKPFALMAHDLETIGRYGELGDIERNELRSPASPIVLLRARAGSGKPARNSPGGAAGPASAREDATEDPTALSPAIAPGSHLLGFMLPYTPLHALICSRFGSPLVMTSGNLSGEPQITDNQEAIEKLPAIADLIVYHDRPIANRIDDSVVRCIGGKARMLRRARGYAPRSIPLPEGLAQADRLLAFGAELKSTFCLVHQGMAILSQHQGDLEDVSTLDDFLHNVGLYQTLFETSPEHFAHDLHPEYLSTKLALQESDRTGVRRSGIPHHHSHIASVLVEHRMPLGIAPVLGLALDGLGYGADGTLWGGEFLLADYRTCNRVGRLKPVAMPGAAKAVTQPWRNTVAHILVSMTWEDFLARYGSTSLAGFLSGKPVATLRRMIEAGLNSPPASSTGRLFDAVAGALELHADGVQFEGQAAIELERLADDAMPSILSGAGGYRLDVAASGQPELVELDASTLWPELLEDLKRGTPKAVVAARFHAGLIRGLLSVVDRLAERFEFRTVALSGGCLQNAILLQALEHGLEQRSLACLTHAQVPANDGGIALGQAVIAAADRRQAGGPGTDLPPSR